MKRYSGFLKIGFLISALFLVLYAVDVAWINYTFSSFDSRKSAVSWQTDELKYANLSAYISEDALFTSSGAKFATEELVSKLAQDSYASANGARVVITNTFASMAATASNDGNSVEATLCVTGPDHFIFHPHDFVSGWHYSGEELMKNCAVINEELAFRLFGGLNVAGLTVKINGANSTIIGVTSGPSSPAESKEWDKAEPMAYVMSGFSDADSTLNITCFEALIPNPVKEYAVTVFEEVMQYDENAEIVENTAVNKYFYQLKKVFSSDKGMMRENKIYYPYWENAVRKKRADMKPFIILSAVLLAVAVIYALSVLVIVFRRKEEIFRNIIQTFKNKFKKRKGAYHD